MYLNTLSLKPGTNCSQMPIIDKYTTLHAPKRRKKPSELSERDPCGSSQSKSYINTRTLIVWFILFAESLVKKSQNIQHRIFDQPKWKTLSLWSPFQNGYWHLPGEKNPNSVLIITCFLYCLFALRRWPVPVRPWFRNFRLFFWYINFSSQFSRSSIVNMGELAAASHVPDSLPACLSLCTLVREFPPFFTASVTVSSWLCHVTRIEILRFIIQRLNSIIR